MPATETAISAALTRAGVNTDEARLRLIVGDAFKKHHGNVERTIATAVKEAWGDTGLFRELMREYVLNYELPGAGHGSFVSQESNAGTRQPNRGGAGQPVREHHRLVARPVREPSSAQISAAATVAKSIAVTVLDRIKTTDGRPWGNVGAHELDGMDRDGALARTVKSRLGPLSNRQRFQTLRQLMTPEAFETCVQSIRETSDAS